MLLPIQPSKGAVETACAVMQIVIEQARIGIERHRRTRMSCDALHYFDVRPMADRQAYRCMAQIVEVDFRNPTGDD